MVTTRSALLAALLLSPARLFAAPGAAPSATTTLDTQRAALREQTGRYSSRMRTLTWTMEGAKLSATQAEELEAAVTRDPDDLSSRVRLVGWLQTSEVFDHRKRLRLIDHLLWLIEHKYDEGPDFWSHLNSGLLMSGKEDQERAIAIWKRHLVAAPGSTPLLESASDFLRFSDPEYSLKLCEQAARISPRDPLWSQKIAYAHLLRTNTRDRELQYSAASSALKYYEQAIGLTREDAEAYSNLHRYAAEAAWLVDRNDKATRWANLLLKNARAGEWWYNNARHEGYTVLGLVALDEGKLDAAGKSLMLSVDIDTKGTGIFAPSLALAAALLDRGQKDIVIEYLESLREQTKYGRERFGKMIAEIHAGGAPEEFKYERRKLGGRKPPKS